MYILNQPEIAQFNVTNAHRFVEFWSQFYDDSVTVFESKAKIDYFSELNVGNNLTEENVRRLLRWKDPHYLTHIHSETRQDNPKAVKALNSLSAINQFRNDQSTEDHMRQTAAEVFPNGPVWQAFLLHIA